MDLPRRADENRPIPPHENATTDRPAARRSRDRGHGCARSRRRGDGRRGLWLGLPRLGTVAAIVAGVVALALVPGCRARLPVAAGLGV